MELNGSAHLQQAVRDIQSYPEYKSVLCVLLKHEISLLLERLSEVGEESIVMTASVTDGAMSVIGSTFGERFALESENDTSLVTGFKERFAEFCYRGRATPAKRRRRQEHRHRRKESSRNLASAVDNITDYTQADVVGEQENMHVDTTQTCRGNRDESDKAIDETVSLLVRNILKESEEREKEVGPSFFRRRRRRRRRNFNDHDRDENQSRQSYSQKEIKMTQFFPDISKKCIEFRASEDDNNKQEHDTCMYLADVKLEPDNDNLDDAKLEQDEDIVDIQNYKPISQDHTSRSTSMEQRCVNENQSTNNMPRSMLYTTKSSVKHRPGHVVCDSVANSMDKSIQKIIEMETQDKPSDNLNNTKSFNLVTIDTTCSGVTVQNGKSQIGENDKLLQDDKSTSTSSTQMSGLATIKKRIDEVIENSIVASPLHGVKDEENHDYNFIEIDNDKKGELQTDPWNRSCEESSVEDSAEIDNDKKGEPQTDPWNRSCEESSVEDSLEDGGYRRRQKRMFIHNGFSYIRDKAGKGNTVYWKCGKLGCKGRVIQRGGEKISTQDHNHGPGLHLEVIKAAMVESKIIKIVCICVTVVCVFVIMNYTVFSSSLSPNKKEKLKRREESEQVRKRNHEYLVNSLSIFAKEDRMDKSKVDTVGVKGHADPVTIPYPKVLDKMDIPQLEELYYSEDRVEKPIMNTVGVKGHADPVNIPYPKVLDKMDVPQLEELYYSYVENIQILCNKQRHIGNEEDGGYHICEDIIQADKPCLIYSFGIRKDFSFDDGIAKHYGCEVHSFDPFDGQFDHIHSPKVTFHSLGIGDKDDPQGKILTLKTIKGNLNHTKVKIDILKIDVEGAEWDSLTEMVNSNALNDVRILIVEFHICIKDCLDGRHRKKEQYTHYLNVLKSIYAVGFRIYFLRMWPYCGFEENGIARTTCHEIHMLKI